MNIIKVIVDALSNPDGAYDRMLEMGVPSEVIDQVLALNRDRNVAITDLFIEKNRQCVTFVVSEDPLPNVYFKQ